jgi:hypothetical protein
MENYDDKQLDPVIQTQYTSFHHSTNSQLQEPEEKLSQNARRVEAGILIGWALLIFIVLLSGAALTRSIIRESASQAEKITMELPINSKVQQLSYGKLNIQT